MKINIKLFDVYEKINETLFCVGKITTDDFCNTFTMSLDYWTLDDYKNQWDECFKRIKIHDTSCLVASVQNQYVSNPLIKWWPLYKEGNKIFIRNELIIGKYKKIIGNKTFSTKTCYEFIQPRHIPAKDEKDPPSEWVIDLE